MQKSYLYLTVILLAHCGVALAQDIAKPKQELGITLLTLERNYETENNPLAWKHMPGIYYLRNLDRRWAWVSSFAYGNNFIDDNCTGCADQIFGIGKLKEWAVQTGFRRQLFQTRRFPVKPFFESGVYYSHLRYSGDFEGGLTGGNFRIDVTHWTTGLFGRFGLTYSPNQLLTLSAYTGYKIGMGGLHEDFYGHRRRSFVMAGSLVQFAVGYRF